MLRKLYKHEWIALYRVMLPLYVVMLGMAVLTRLTTYINSDNSVVLEFIKNLTMGLTVAAIVGAFFAGVAFLVIRFYQNLLTKQGYLTNTLPFKAHHHIVCKMLCAVVVEITNAIVTALSFLIIFGTKERVNAVFDGAKEAFELLAQCSSKANAIACVAEAAVVLLLSLAAGLLMMYACMSIGQQFKSKILGSIVAYFCLYTVNQMLGVILMLAGLGSGILTDEEIFASSSVTNLSQGLLLFVFVLIALQGIAYYWISNHFLSKKLNLE